MANNLIIGLGGTGGKIIREFRRCYYEEFKTFTSQDGTYVDYLYVDSDETDLKTNWKIQGVNIGLSNSQKVSTHGMSISDLDQLYDRPSLNCFIKSDEVDTIKDKLGRVITEGIGGQRRRLGRMLLASHNNQQDGFANQLIGRVQDLVDKSGNMDVNFHIVAGLAGGTGSGSVIDAVAQIREKYKDGPSIYLYLYVPEQQTIYTENIDYYKANGYAALLEINAIQTGVYNPVLISGEKDYYTKEAKRLQSDQPINGTYLFCNINERGKTLKLDTELPEMVGDFLFHKIVLNNDPKGADALKRIEKYENNDTFFETDGAGKLSRSLKFLSFGYRRVIFPEEEIKEYIGYKFAERAALQMHYQKWTPKGYVASSKEGATEEITSRLVMNERDSMFLSNKILMRESSLPGTEPIHEFYDTFKTPSDSYADEALKLDKNEMLNSYNANMGSFFKKKFRRMGVVDYFVQESSEVSKYAHKIVSKIEEILFQRWENGTYGALQIEEYVKLLIKDCDNRISEFSKLRHHNDSQIERLRSEMSKAEEEVSKTRLFGNTFGKRDEKFNLYKDQVLKYYVALTRNEAEKYAMTLLEAVKIGLQELESIILRFTALLSLVAEKAEIEANERCRDEEDNEAKTMRKYDKTAVNEIKDKAIKTKDTQLQITRNVRNELVKHMGDSEEKSFFQFLKSFDAMEESLEIPSDNVLSLIMDVCLKSAEKEVEDRSVEDKRLKVTNVNILEKIRQEYGEGEKLQKFAQDLMNSAQTFVRFNQSEVNLESNGNKNRRNNSVIVYLPEEKDESGFRDRLITALKEAKTGATKVIIATGHRQDQIAVMTLNSLFPLRHIDNVKSLKESYDKLVNSPEKEIHKLVLHTETFGEPLPSLFEASVNELAIEVPKPVLLGYAMGIIGESTDYETGRKSIYYFVKDKYGDGLDRSDHPIGKDFQSVVKNLMSNRRDLALIKAEIDERLKKDFKHIDAKKELMSKVSDVLKSIVLQSVDGDEFHPEYVKYKKVRNDLFENELNID